MQTYAGQTLSGKSNDPQQRGIAALENALVTSHAILDSVFGHLSNINERLYPAKPTSVPPVDGAAIPHSVENGLHQLNSRLRELEHLAQSILHG